MKMAKASQRDIDAAIELYQFLQAMADGRAAYEAVDEFGYEGYDDLVERQANDTEFLLRAHERGGLFRVVWGLQVLLDPANEIVDPNLPHLELHPKHSDAAGKAADWQQTTEDMDAAQVPAASFVNRVRSLIAQRDAAMQRAASESEALFARNGDVARIGKQRDELVNFVESTTAQFERWSEANPDRISGQEEEVAADHNWMLEALIHLHRFARMPSAAPRLVRGEAPAGGGS
jgi:hypothetical protein